MSLPDDRPPAGPRSLTDAGGHPRPPYVARSRTTELPYPDWAPTFLSVFRDTGIPRMALLRAGISRDTLQSHKRRCPQFAAEFRAAQEDAMDLVEAAVRTSALGGNMKAAIPLLRAYRPKRWAPASTVQHQGTITMQHTDARALLAAKLRPPPDLVQLPAGDGDGVADEIDATFTELDGSPPAPPR